MGVGVGVLTKQYSVGKGLGARSLDLTTDPAYLYQAGRLPSLDPQFPHLLMNQMFSKHHFLFSNDSNCSQRYISIKLRVITKLQYKQLKTGTAIHFLYHQSLL